MKTVYSYLVDGIQVTAETKIELLSEIIALQNILKIARSLK